MMDKHSVSNRPAQREWEIPERKPRFRLFCAILAVAFFASPTAFSAPSETLLRVSRVVDGDTLVLSDGVTVRLIGIDTPEHDDEARNRRNARSFGIDPSDYSGFAFKAHHQAERIVFDNDWHEASDVILYDKPRRIRLELDPVNAPTRHRDAYGRILAYVWVRVPINELTGEPNYQMASADSLASTLREVLLNAELIKEGCAASYGRFPHGRRSEFYQLQKAAKAARRGMWAFPAAPSRHPKAAKAAKGSQAANAGRQLAAAK